MADMPIDIEARELGPGGRYELREDTKRAPTSYAEPKTKLAHELSFGTDLKAGAPERGCQGLGCRSPGCSAFSQRSSSCLS